MRVHCPPDSVTAPLNVSSASGNDSRASSPEAALPISNAEVSSEEEPSSKSAFNPSNLSAVSSLLLLESVSRSADPLLSLSSFSNDLSPIRPLSAEESKSPVRTVSPALSSVSFESSLSPEATTSPAIPSASCRVVDSSKTAPTLSMTKRSEDSFLVPSPLTSKAA